MTRTPLEIIQHYIDSFQETKTSPEAQIDPERIASLNMKIYLLETIKLDMQLEYDIEPETEVQDGEPA